MRYSLIALALVFGGCGTDVRYGGMLSDEAMTSPDGGHATYIDPPNFSRSDNFSVNAPQPAAAQLPGNDGRP